MAIQRLTEPQGIIHRWIYRQAKPTLEKLFSLPTAAEVAAAERTIEAEREEVVEALEASVLKGLLVMLVQ